MSIFYLKDIKNVEDILSDKEKNLPNFIKKIVTIMKIRFGTIFKNGNIIVLPIMENEQISTKKLNKIVYNVTKNNICKSVVLSKSLNSNDALKSVLYSQNIDILNGRYLFRFLIFMIVDFILVKKNKKIQDIELSVLVNELDEINLKTILILAKRVKRLNIITNHIELFKRIEKKLYDDGVIIMISNNKRKSLLKTDIVVNIDFVEENLKEYKLNNNCIVINVSNDIKIYNKGFNGINVNNYNINFECEIIENFISEFDSKFLYESKIYFMNDFDRILDVISEDKVVVSELIGNKGSLVDF